MALAGLRTGTENMKTTGGAGRFTPYISWSDGDAKTIAFLTPAESIAKVKIHNFVKINDDSEKGFHWATFMCRKDPAWAEESNNQCPLCDIHGHKVKEQNVGIAVELNPITKPGSAMVVGLEPVIKTFKKQDGTEGSTPQWGLVIQSFGNFWNYFYARAKKYGEITGVAYDISRVGNDKNTTYVIDALNNIEVPDLSEYNIPDLADVLESMGSVEKYESELGDGSGVELSEYDKPESEDLETEFSKLKESLGVGTQAY